MQIPPIGILNPAASDALGRLTTQTRGAGDAKGTDAEKLHAAAAEFEALFLGYMLKVMRETVEDSGAGEKGLGQSTYTELFDQEVARCLAERGALGISDLLVRNLQNKADGVNHEPPNHTNR